MTTKNTIITSTFLLAIMATLPSFAETKAEDAVTIECITADEVEAMTAEDRAKLTLPICEDIQNEEGKMTTQ